MRRCGNDDPPMYLLELLRSHDPDQCGRRLLSFSTSNHAEEERDKRER